MKNIYLIILLLAPLFVKGQDWQWAKRIGSNHVVEGAPFFSDNNDNIYVAGIYHYDCYFETDTLTSNGYVNMYIAKYDQHGNETWVKELKVNIPINFDKGIQAHPDNTGNFIIAVGTFCSTLTVDGNTITPLGLSDIFIAKFDLDGNCLWLERGGGIGYDVSNAFTLDSNNDIFLTGSNSDTAMFDSFIVPPGGLFAKYDLNGTCLFAEKKYEGMDITDIKPMGFDLVLSGSLRDTTIVLDTITIILTRSSAILGKIDSNGNVEWVKLFGGSFVCGYSFDLDSQNNIYYTGYFEDSVTFDGTTISHSPGTTYPDFFLAKLDSNGNAQWAKQSNSSEYAHGYAVCADESGNVYLSGDFSGIAVFGDSTASAGTRSDFFLTRYDTYGDCLGVRHFGVAISATSMVSDNNGNVIVGGQFIDTIDFGSQYLTSTNGINPDVFIAKGDEIKGIEVGRIAHGQLIIYANPNAGKCNIIVPEDFLQEKNLTLSIYDNLGKLIQQATLLMNDGKISVDLEAEARGVYNVSLSNAKKSYSGRIVFE